MEKLSRLVLLFLAAAASSVPLTAGVVYTYAGNTFPSAQILGSPGVGTSDSITASITLSAPLGPGDTAYGTDFLAWSISDGPLTYDQNNGSLVFLPPFIEMDPTSGLITSWFLLAVPTNSLDTSGDGNVFNYETAILETSSSGSGQDSVSFYTVDFTPTGDSAAVASPGVWSEVSQGDVPEPGTVALAALGGLSLLALRKLVPGRSPVKT